MTNKNNVFFFLFVVKIQQLIKKVFNQKQEVNTYIKILMRLKQNITWY